MTRKDYALIARALNEWYNDRDAEPADVFVAVAVALGHDNPAFDRGKFIAACNAPRERAS